MSLSKTLLEEVDNGRIGKNGCIPFPIGKLDNYVEISKNTNYLIAGDTGSGKSTLAQEIIIGCLDWYQENRKGSDIKLSIIYFGMERKQYMYTAKWISRMIYLNERKLVSVKKILGRKKNNGVESLLSDEEYDLVVKYSKILDEWEKDDTFICIEGTHNPTGIKIYLDEFALKHGTLTKRGEGTLDKSTYTPHHPNHIVLVVTDYVGVLDPEKDENGQKKLRLDKYSWAMRRVRDLYGFSPINIQQLSRAVNDYTRLKLNDLKPKLSDIADTSELARDADVVLVIFEPFRYVTQDTNTDLLGYNLNKLRDMYGYKYYRSLHILKSSFDGDGIAVGVAFHPSTGIIKVMPNTPSVITDKEYESIVNGSYFFSYKKPSFEEYIKTKFENG